MRSRIAEGAPTTDTLTAADCRVAVETDYQLFQKFGTVGGVTNYVSGLFSAVSDRYFTDIQTTLSIAYLGIYTTAADPWTSQDSGGNSGALLNEFVDAWTPNAWPASANLAHFVSGANLGGGVAYLDVLCNQSFGFGVSGNVAGNIDWSSWTGQPGNFIWDFVVVAHEIGHNFGSQHTHSLSAARHLLHELHGHDVLLAGDDHELLPRAAGWTTSTSCSTPTARTSCGRASTPPASGSRRSRPGLRAVPRAVQPADGDRLADRGPDVRARRPEHDAAVQGAAARHGAVASALARGVRADTLGRMQRVRAVAIVAGLSTIVPAAQDATRRVDFARDVKPIFEVHCIACHGPKKQKGDYRSSTFERAIEELAGRKSIVPGSPGASDFFRRLVSEDSDLRMPQKELPLDPLAIEILRRWIEQGARETPLPVSGHWAFIPPVEPETPAVKDRAWIRNPIDRFVLAKLEASGKAPCRRRRRKLLERIRLDLAGIPPTADELEAFEKDTAPDVRARGRPSARLAGLRRSHGGMVDGRAPCLVSPERRAWIVQAFEKDLAFDAFTRELLTEDLLERRAGEIWLGMAVPAALGGVGGDPPKDRAGLARWIASAVNPLTARVAVNRIWALLFGKGIVASLEDFGEHGDPPADKELLDWLALDFAGNGWSIRHLVKRIVTSSTYRQVHSER